MLFRSPQNVVFGDGELYRSSQLKTDTQAIYSFSPLGFTSADGKITLSSPDVSANIKTISTDASIQLFKFDSSATYTLTEAYIGSGLSTPPYYNPSEIVIGDLIVYNNAKPNTTVSGSAVVPNIFNYIGLSPYTYITAQNIVFEIGRAHV